MPRKIDQDTVEKLIDKETTRTEIQVLTVVISLTKYYHQKYIDELESKLARLQVGLEYPKHVN